VDGDVPVRDCPGAHLPDFVQLIAQQRDETPGERCALQGRHGFGTRCNAAARDAFASLTACKTARCKQEKPNVERDSEAVSVREGVVWVRKRNDRALQLRCPVRLQADLPVRRQLRL